MPRLTAHHDAIVVRTSQTGKLSGRLYYPRPDWSRMEIFRFTVGLPASQDNARQLFNLARAEHYQRLLDRQLPGAAWFRHEARQSQRGRHPRRELEPGAATLGPPGATFGGPTDLSNTYELFSGGRALSENLQLDRMIRTTDAASAAEATVDISKIDGITVSEIDWKPLVKRLEARTRPAGRAGSGRSARRVLPQFLGGRESGRRGRLGGHAPAAVGRAAVGGRADGEAVRAAIGPVADRPGPAAGATGGPERRFDRFRSVFPHRHRRGGAVRGREAALLEALLAAQITQGGGARADGQPESGLIEGSLPGRPLAGSDGLRPIRGRLGGAVVVTNSLYQLGRLAAVQSRQVAGDRDVAGIRLFSPSLSPGRPGRNGVGVPERRDDPPLVRPAMADRRLASNPRHGGPGRAPGDRTWTGWQRDGRSNRARSTPILPRPMPATFAGGGGRALRRSRAR